MKDVQFARTLGKTETSDLSFAAPFHSLWMATLCRSGALTLSRGINLKVSITSISPEITS